MPVLNWIGKDKVVNHDKELPLRVLKPNKKLSVGENSGNLLIEGDNLEALKALMPFYYGKIKCVYIDPPYNTGNEGWVYNDRVNAPQIKSWLNKVVGAEGEDLCRHDKWLCMMYPRLKLLRDLLSEDGAIFISIDDNEVHNLRKIMDEIFGEPNFVANIIWEKKYTTSNNVKGFSATHDFILVYSKNIEFLDSTIKRFSYTDEARSRYSNPDSDPRGDWKDNSYHGPKSPKERPNLNYPIIHPKTKEEIWPKEKSWAYEEAAYRKHVEENRLYWGKNFTYKEPRLKVYLSEIKGGMIPRTIWNYEDFGTNSQGRSELREIFGLNIESGIPFDSPKPTTLIKRIISISSNNDDIILDSFAGSGTTGQAVMELNKEEGGNRKFILVELEKDIAKNVTAKRLQKVSEGYKGALFTEGTDQGFQYLDLNGVLYDSSGFVNPNATYEDMAAYIYFTETKNYLDISSIKNPYIGTQGTTSYFLFFQEKGNNILDEKTLGKTDSYKGQKVIYADKCLIDDEYLEKKGIVFKQIPYELKKY